MVLKIKQLGVSAWALLGKLSYTFNISEFKKLTFLNSQTLFLAALGFPLV